MNSFTYMLDKNFSEGRRYIGASDMFTLSGRNDYKTPYEFWAERTGRTPAFTGNFRTAEGHIKEDGIIAKYLVHKILVEEIGPDYTAEQWLDCYNSDYIKNFLVSRLWEENEYQGLHSWTEAVMPTDDPILAGRIVAHADLLDMRGEIPILVQAKNTGTYAAATRKRNPFKGYAKDDLSQNGIPIGVYLQEQAEMMCYGLPEAYVAVEIGGNDWKLYGPVKYNKKTAEKLLKLSRDMLECIDNDTPPDPKSWADTIAMFPDIEKNTKATVTGQDEIDALEMKDQFNRTTEKIRILEARKLDITMALAGLAAEPQLGQIHNYLCASDGSKIASFSEMPGRNFISLSELKKRYPTEYEQYETEGLITESKPTRRIFISGAQAGTVDLWTCITYSDNGKPKKSRKKYTAAEKNDYSKFADNLGVKTDWERYGI